PHLPELCAAQHPGRRWDAKYKVCVDRARRRPVEIKPIVGVEGADPAIVDALSTWSWEIEAPASARGPLCFVENLEFAVEPHLRTGLEPLPPLPAPTLTP